MNQMINLRLHYGASAYSGDICLFSVSFHFLFGPVREKASP